MTKRQNQVKDWLDIISGDKGFYRSLQFMPRGDGLCLSPCPIPRICAPVRPISKETANEIASFIAPADDSLLPHYVPSKEVQEYKKRLVSLMEQEQSTAKDEIIEMVLNETLAYIKSDEFAARIDYLCTLNAIKDANRIQIKSDMKNEQVVHVCLGDDRHYYFGSVAAIFDRFTPDELGVSLTTLWNYGLAPDRPYKNNRCAIYRGIINRKRQNK